MVNEKKLKDFIETDDFLVLSMEARLLFYDFAVRADENGIIKNPVRIMQMTDASHEALEELEIFGLIREGVKWRIIWKEEG